MKKFLILTLSLFLVLSCSQNWDDKKLEDEKSSLKKEINKLKEEKNSEENTWNKKEEEKKSKQEEKKWTWVINNEEETTKNEEKEEKKPTKKYDWVKVENKKIWISFYVPEEKLAEFFEEKNENWEIATISYSRFIWAISKYPPLARWAAEIDKGRVMITSWKTDFNSYCDYIKGVNKKYLVDCSYNKTENWFSYIKEVSYYFNMSEDDKKKIIMYFVENKKKDFPIIEVWWDYKDEKFLEKVLESIEEL